MNSNSACNTTLFKSWKKPLPSQWHVMVTCSCGHPQGQQWCGCESMWVTSELCAHILSPQTRWLCPAHTCGKPPPPPAHLTQAGGSFWDAELGCVRAHGDISLTFLSWPWPAGKSYLFSQCQFLTSRRSESDPLSCHMLCCKAGQDCLFLLRISLKVTMTWVLLSPFLTEAQAGGKVSEFLFAMWFLQRAGFLLNPRISHLKSRPCRDVFTGSCHGNVSKGTDYHTRLHSQITSAVSRGICRPQCKRAYYINLGRRYERMEELHHPLQS